MTRLIIKNFSCVDSADVELANMTILIGPQASGKSVVSKLLHFFIESLGNMIGTDFEFEESTIEEYSRKIIENFKKSFPAQAWGLTAFSIEFLSGPISIKISRSKPRKGTVGNLKIEFSDDLSNMFIATQDEYKLTKSKSLEAKSSSDLPRGWELLWKVRQSSQKRLKNLLRDDFVSHQLFIPAGRSFFTSMGKAVVAFEHGGFLDPLTIRFGKYFLAMRDHLGGRGFMYRSARAEKVRKDRVERQEKLSESLFSGKIRMEKNEEYIESSDGRRTPFSIMSSGQQELLPLWVTINEFMDGESDNSLVYIEEPEAHLFPSAQGMLIDYLVGLLGSSPNQKMLITTHSPYILSKVNNLLKAGSLSSRVSKREQASIEEVISKISWLKPDAVAAYAIVDRKLTSIKGEDGFIDGEYLDGVSGEISRDFNSLLELEYAK